ncbi:ankyrin repeat protein [Trichoderma velutinum]
MSSAPASTLASTSTLVIDILARFPAEIINRIVDNLHPSLIYFHLFVEPKTASVQSSLEQCQRVREICISHNVKFGRMDVLTYAISSNDRETMKYILEEASMNAKTSGKKHTVVEHAPRSLWKIWLYWSVNEDHLDISRQLMCVDGIANYLNRRDRCFDKLLLLAAKDQNLTLMRLLLENGANPDIADDSKDTPLHFVAVHNNREAIEMLAVQYQADVNGLGSAGNTPLIWAIEHGDIDMVKVYLQSPRLNLYKPNLWGQTALHKALSNGKPQIAELLLTWSGGDLDEHKDTHGKTPLMLCLAKMAGLEDMTPYIPTFKQLLVAKRADPQAFSKQYETVMKDVLDEYDSCFWQELIVQVHS